MLSPSAGTTPGASALCASTELLKKTLEKRFASYSRSTPKRRHFEMPEIFPGPADFICPRSESVHGALSRKVTQQRFCETWWAIDICFFFAEDRYARVFQGVIS